MVRGEKIDSNEFLYRRGYNSPEKRFLNPDGTATSRVFKLREKDNQCLSVDLAKLTTPQTAVLNKNEFNLFQICNSSIEEIDLKTIYDANFKSVINSHCLIIGMELDDDVKPAYLARKSLKIYP